MKVEIVSRSANDEGRPLTDPLPEDYGILWRRYTGDYFDPIGGTWMKPRLPWFIVYRKIAREKGVPFLAWRFRLPFGLPDWTGYLGFKAYGCDLEPYLARMPADVVHTGSTAMHLSFRPFAGS